MRLCWVTIVSVYICGSNMYWLISANEFENIKRKRLHLNLYKLSYKLPAIQRRPHCLLVIFFPFAAWLPEPSVDNQQHFYCRCINSCNLESNSRDCDRNLPKIWKSSFRFASWRGLVWLLCNRKQLWGSVKMQWTTAIYSHHILILQTFRLFSFAFGLPLLDIAHESRGGMCWQGVFRGGQGTSTAFNTISHWCGQRWTAGQLCCSLKYIFRFSWIIFLCVPRIADWHWEGQALLHGPPPSVRLLLLLLLLLFLLFFLLLLFSFL